MKTGLGEEYNRIEKLSITAAVLLFLRKGETRKTSLKFLGTIVVTFFIPQYQGRLKLKRRKIVNVDHELDNLIPFSPEYMGIYLSFSHLWIKSIYFLYKEFGKRSLPHISRFIFDIGKLYRNGYSVSSQCQSTTTRPRSGKNIPLKMIHWIDPHLHCVPSLHVMIVCFNHLRISSLIETLAGNTRLYEKELKYLEYQAVIITNSILFMKQHSINCIPAGLFALADECEEFSDYYAETLVEKVYSLNRDTVERMDEIYTYILQLYADFRKSAESRTRRDVLVDFLYNYNTESTN
ncbi:MAG: hypothetical protein L3J12_00520 [Spirochaetales bacterium]|nr:hypothetical protein [Spirochaetales bacterium]